MNNESGKRPFPAHVFADFAHFVPKNVKVTFVLFSDVCLYVTLANFQDKLYMNFCFGIFSWNILAQKFSKPKFPVKFVLKVCQCE